MGAITGTKQYGGEFAGEVKLVQLTAPIGSESDVITLNAADHAGAVSIVGIVGAVITAGADAAFQFLQVSFSGLDITVDSFGEDGLAATDFTGTTVALSVLVKTTA